jgi:hypothetical protein
MSRAVGLFHALRGIRVIPNLRWGDSRDYDFCFLGVEQGSAVAVSNHGLWNDQLLRHNFLPGLPVMAERIQPKVVLCPERPMTLPSDAWSARASRTPRS